MKRTLIAGLVFVMILIICTPAGLIAQTIRSGGKNDTGMPSPGVSQSGKRPVVLHRTRRIRWDAQNQILTAEGNVHAQSDRLDIRADTLEYHQRRNTIIARGNVEVVRPNSDNLSGPYFKYNRSTGEVRIKRSEGKFSHWYYDAGTMEGKVDTSIVARNGSFSTCNLSTPHYDLTASTFYIYPGNYMVGYNVRFNLAGVPVTYFPYVWIDLKGRFARWEFHYGINDRDGMILGVDYHYLMERDREPVTGTVYTDFRETNSPAYGMDVKYNDSNGKASVFYMQANRNPLINEDDDDVRTDTEEHQFLFKSEGNYNIPGTNWNIQGKADWQSHSRFNKDIIQSVRTRTQAERILDGSLTWSGEQSLLQISGKRRDRVLSGDSESFERQELVLPEIKYQLYSTPVSIAGRTFYYKFSGTGKHFWESNEDERLWDYDASTSLTKSLAWNSTFRQSYRLGYRQHVFEQALGDTVEYESDASMEFELRNTLRLTSSLDMDLNYSISPRMDERDSVDFTLNGRDLGFEESGLDKHELDVSWRWYGENLYAFLRTGYDLRNSRSASVASDSRVQSPSLTLNSQLTPTLSWSEFLRYNWQDRQLQQINSQLLWDPLKRFSTSLGWNYNARSSGDLSKLTHSLFWKSPGEQWRFKGNVTYNVQSSEMDETSIKLMKRLHMWEMHMSYREIQDRDRQFMVMFNLMHYPSKSLEFEQGLD